MEPLVPDQLGIGQEANRKEGMEKQEPNYRLLSHERMELWRLLLILNKCNSTLDLKEAFEELRRRGLSFKHAIISFLSKTWGYPLATMAAINMIKCLIGALRCSG